MPRPATGQVEEHPWKDGRTVTFRLRARAYGRRWRVHLGTNHEGWSAERAAVELEKVLARIERGTWEPPTPELAVVEEPDHETFHVYASRWWAAKHRLIEPRTRSDYRWRLDHLLRELAHVPVVEINVRRVKTVRDALIERGLAPRSVNMVLGLLAQILDDAVDDELLEANPARGRRRRLRVPAASRSFLEPDMVVDLLAAASTWEARLPEHQRFGRRAMLATYAIIGPRLQELTQADRHDADLAAGRLRIGRSKTAAGVRHAELPAFLVAELAPHLAKIPADGPLFPTRTGGRHAPSNVRRFLRETVERANTKRAKTGRPPIPAITPHSLRRTATSLMLAAGRDPRFVMAQLGHADARFTLSVYAQVMQRQRVDAVLIWSLMRYAGEAEQTANGRLIGPLNGPTPASGPNEAEGEDGR